MIEGIGIALQKYYGDVLNAKDYLERETARIKENCTGASYAENIGIVQTNYNNAVMKSRTDNCETCIGILDKVAQDARTFATQPVPSDFISSLETIKNTKGMTPDEINSFKERYSNNYMAYRAICSVFGDDRDVLAMVTIDDVIKEIEDTKKELHRCFFSYSVEQFKFYNMMRGTILEHLDEYLKLFLEGRFIEAGHVYMYDPDELNQ